jgi:hypothetical protein
MSESNHFLRCENGAITEQLQNHAEGPRNQAISLDGKHDKIPRLGK